MAHLWVLEDPALPALQDSGWYKLLLPSTQPSLFAQLAKETQDKG